MSTITNKLTKAFASGSLAIGVATLVSLAVSTLIASSVQAATVGSIKSSTTFTAVDKTISNLKFSSGISSAVDFTFNYSSIPDLYVVQLNFGSNHVLTKTSQWFSYDITIDPSNPYYFDTIALSADLVGKHSLVTNDIVQDKVSLTRTALGSNQFASFKPLTYKTLHVKNTFSIGGKKDGVISVSNVFTQEAKPTPEPSVVLSLLVLGGLGLVSLKRKQS